MNVKKCLHFQKQTKKFKVAKTTVNLKIATSYIILGTVETWVMSSAIH